MSRHKVGLCHLIMLFLFMISSCNQELLPGPHLEGGNFEAEYVGPPVDGMEVIYAKFNNGDVHAIPYMYQLDPDPSDMGKCVDFDAEYLAFHWPSKTPLNLSDTRISPRRKQAVIVFRKSDREGIFENGIHKGIKAVSEASLRILDARSGGYKTVEGPDGLVGYIDPRKPTPAQDPKHPDVAAGEVAPYERRAPYTGEVYYPGFRGGQSVFLDPNDPNLLIKCNNRYSFANAGCEMNIPYRDDSQLAIRFQYYFPDDPESIDAGHLKDWRALRSFVIDFYDRTLVEACGVD